MGTGSGGRGRAVGVRVAGAVTALLVAAGCGGDGSPPPPAGAGEDGGSPPSVEPVLDDAGCRAGAVALGAVLRRPLLAAEGADRAVLDELDAVGAEAEGLLPLELRDVLDALERVVERNSAALAVERRRVERAGWPPSLEGLQALSVAFEAEIDALGVARLLVEPCRGRVGDLSPP